MAEVHFCNLCDRSVPLAEVQDGSCARSGERLLCPDCLELLGRAGLGRAGGGLAWAALVAALLGWAAAALLWWQLQVSGDELEGSLNLARGELDRAVAEAGERAAAGDAALAEDLSLVREEVLTLRRAQEDLAATVEGGFARLQSGLEALAPLAAAQDELAQRFGRVEATLSVVEDRQRSNRANLDGLRDRIQALEAATAALAAAAPPAEEETFSGEVSALLRKLQDEDPEVRYGALEKLSSIPDERLLPHLYPLLADPYEFTRFLAAHTFGEWDARPAVPHLIEALLDEVAFVREAAVRSLRRITGQNFGYQHDGEGEQARAAREAAYRQWKSWWEANGAAFLAG
ncbi:MAG: HEAT repeat domain-containing protein [Planctomycetota bacterium]|nr:MAG: HEAT repeat domain-containing protein [Planctomycetota bacterium]